MWLSYSAARHTLVKFDVTSASNNNNENNRMMPFRVEIMYLHTVIHNSTSAEQNSLNISITTQKFGVYRFCITNEASTFNTLVFEFLTGIHAKDYGSHHENEDYVDSIGHQARIAEQFTEEIKQENKEGLEIMSQNSISVNKYSIEYFFTLLFVGATC